jgi:hypothetical protein
MSLTLRSIGFFGVLLFGSLFLVTFVSPETIESSAKGFVKYQIEKEVREKQAEYRSSAVVSNALIIAEKLGLESNAIQQNLKDNLPEKIASVIASMCGYDCERKKQIAQSITKDYIERIQSINIAQSTLGDLIKGKYVEIITNLKTDLRIFLGSNFSMFFILLLVSFVKPKAMVHLFVPGILLAVAAVISSSIYIYGQDWFYTILYNDYMGFGYLAYMTLIFSLLVDIILNQARITTEVINFIGHMFSAAFSVAPC